MSAGAVRAGRAFVELTTDDSGLRRGLDNAQKRLMQFGAGLVAAGASIIGPLTAAAVSVASTGDELDKMSLRTGASVEGLSALKFAADQSGTSLDAVSNGLQKMNRNLSEAEGGGGPAADALRELGLSAKDLLDLPVEERLKRIAGGIARIPDVGKQSATAFRLFGGASKDLLPLLQQGEEGIAALMERAHELGIVMSTEDATAAAAFTDAMDVLNKQMASVKNTVGAALLPVLTELATSLEEPLKLTIQWVNENREMVVTLFKWAGVAAAVGAGMLAMGGAIKVVIAIVNAYRLAVKAAAAAKMFLLALTGKGIVLIGLAAAAAAGGIYLMNQSLEGTTTEAQEAAGALEEVNQAAGRVVTNNIARNYDDLRAAIERAMTPAQKMRAELMKIREVESAFEDTVNNSRELREAFDRLRNEAVESATGIFSKMRGVRDEILLLKGAATETGLELKRMLENGAPAELVQQYAKLIELRDNLVSDKEADAKKKQDFEKAQAEARRLKEQHFTPEERLMFDAKRLMELRNVRDDQGRSVLDDATFEREMERIQRQAREAMVEQAGLGAHEAREQAGLIAASDVRSAEGLSTVLRALGGGRDPAEETAQHTQRLVEIDERVLQVVQFIERKVDPPRAANLR